MAFDDARDREIWGYAVEHEAVLVTKDEDFSDMMPFVVPAPVVVWVRIGNTRRRALLAWFSPLIDRIVAMVGAGHRLIELR
ncbi:DUF5615 family PIN-like protein [Arthrobacter castelli]|uniref:DUF5615 family PIN-like protein n=1 Tax=Arthrobacter castelli TaxID=271431 RepID=UPI0005664A11